MDDSLPFSSSLSRWDQDAKEPVKVSDLCTTSTGEVRSDVSYTEESPRKRGHVQRLEKLEFPVVVTPFRVRKRTDDEDAHHTRPQARRRLHPDYDPLPDDEKVCALETQDFPFSQDSVIRDDASMGRSHDYLSEYTGNKDIPIRVDNGIDFVIGRKDKDNTVDINIPCEGDENYISRKHCRLCYSVVTQSYRILPLDGPVYVMKQGRWQEVPKGEAHILSADSPFRLVPPSKKRGTKPWDQFSLKQTALPCTARWRPG